MPSRDAVHRMSYVQTLANTAVTNGNTATNGAWVDTLGYEAVTLCARVGARTDGNYTFKIQDADDGSGTNSADLAAGAVIGGTNSTGALSAVGNALLGVAACRRFVRAVCTQAGGTTGATFQADFRLGKPRHSGAGV